MHPLNVLAEKAFDLYVDEVGNLFARAEDSEFQRDSSVKLSTARPLWAVVDFSCDPRADVSIELKSRQLTRTAVQESAGEIRTSSNSGSSSDMRKQNFPVSGHGRGGNRRNSARSGAARGGENNNGTSQQGSYVPSVPPPINSESRNQRSSQAASTTTTATTGNRANATRPADMTTEEPPSRHYPMVICSDRLNFHSKVGENVSVSSADKVARRSPGRSRNVNCYVFSSHPFQLRQGIVIKILNNIGDGEGSLAFGLTSCNPCKLENIPLPDDPLDLMDRLEYWVVQKDIAKDFASLDEVCFLINSGGEVTTTKNGCLDSGKTLMHVDTSVPLWAFFDLIGSTTAIQIIGTVSHVMNMAAPPPSSPQKNTGAPSAPNLGENADDFTDCVICYDNPMDTVIYTCGHLCMCFACASTYDKGKGCPICRQPILDVIRMFKA